MTMIKDTLTTLPQYLLPQHTLSRLMSRLTHSENVAWKNFFIRQIVRHYGVNMDEALDPNIEAYKSFNRFFTRELKPGIRPLTSEQNAIACPADGAVSQAGSISGGTIFQAKGKNFTAIDLLGGNAERAMPFQEGVFATIYLSPKDYHRLHMPLTGTLREMVHIPGCLFSVNTATANVVPGLFARNERVAAIFDTEAGPMALVLVGAIFVSSIETVWHGVVTPPTVNSVQTWRYDNDAPVLQIGEEMGRFNMGSTIIVLFGKDRAVWRDGLTAGEPVKLGEMIGKRL
ncbi:archaetidylserine decarboxylase [Methylomicrobium sp. Wu6]|uniref:archaetidylserine decarboxylase n=1 Tax=Methylomicrobium sp. Wu6 TaxID=3107928 RepID=UPI002DD63868|nr:archaetidylserine decarboxylase [Methylomicrobium sp. Wu6]MEC4750658.1 archaetidylserine decarboxylase [Methylomicrobium sp. Wu6]